MEVFTFFAMSTTIFVIAVSPQSLSAAMNVQRKTTAGQVIGNVTASKSGDVQTYLGIPYAEPPTGNLRFKAPKAKSSWPGVLEAYKFGNICPQEINPYFPMPYTQNENCLFLNVFVPGENTTEHQRDRLAIMIFVHGGGYIFGSADMYNYMELALTGNVIVVTMNYRLALLGFFSTGDTNAPGNYGLWDQRLSFKWVQENIANFGGDPSRVTIFGESAGSTSVSLHALSAKNKGLFKRVISESGTALSPFAITSDVYMVSFKQKLANATGCRQYLSSTAQLLNCLRSKTTASIIKAQQEVLAGGIIGPRYDNDFLTNTAEDILKYKNASQDTQEFASSLQYMTGCNSVEGGMAFLLFGEVNKSDLSEGVPRSNVMIYNYLFASSVNTPDANLMIAAISSQYAAWDDDYDPVERARGWIDAYGDMAFLAATVATASAYSSLKNGTGHSYMYLFSHDHPGFLRSPNTPAWYSGASHAEELHFVFGEGNLNFTREEEILQKQIMSLWGNFAKTGNPNQPLIEGVPLWPQYTDEGKHYIELKVNMTIKTDLHPKRVRFWMDFVPKLVKRPVKPCEPVIASGSVLYSQYWSISCGVLLLLSPLFK